uniref:TOTE conflict system archaeo-eukaryotic primase domain-containing protein n=1 Tax=Parasutterella excrementihominis TaxID=487175 RepID=UPI003FED463A
MTVLTQKTPSLNLPFAHETPKNTDQEKPSDSAPLTPQQKISLFYELLKGRGDAFAERWESFYDPQKVGYSSICIKRFGECQRPYSFCKTAPISSHQKTLNSTFWKQNGWNLSAPEWSMLSFRCH